MTEMTPGLPADIRLIDDEFQGVPQTIATYLLTGPAPALVDPGPASTIPALERGLAAYGLAPADLHAILLTHIHLDHAGATGLLVARNPHLRVYVHTRGAPHLITPDKLLRSAERLYGDAMQQLWGQILPLPQDRIQTLSGGETLDLGGRRLRVFDAPGHAIHHLLYLDEASGAAFIGDTGGLRLPQMTHGLPATPPPDIDIEAWQQTLTTLHGLRPSLLLLTHFGPAFDVEAHIADHQERLWQWALLVREGLASGADEASQIARLQALAEQSLPANATEAERAAFRFGNPVDLGWHGLARYWRKRAR